MSAGRHSKLSHPLRLIALAILLIPAGSSCSAANNSGGCDAQGTGNTVNCVRATGLPTSTSSTGNSNTSDQDSPTPPTEPSASPTIQPALSYQQVPLDTLCQGANSNNFYDSCPGDDNFSTELDGRDYSFALDTLVGYPRSIATFTNATCKSLTLRLGIQNESGVQYPPNLQMTLTVVQGNLPSTSVTIPFNKLVTWSVKLNGSTWEIDGEANESSEYWALFMDGTAICSTSTGTSNE